MRGAGRAGPQWPRSRSLRQPSALPSTASANRVRAVGPPPALRRSITTSIVCLMWRSSPRLSARAAILPSTRARTYPARDNSSNRSRNSPSGPSPRGRARHRRSRRGTCSIRATICSRGLCRDRPVTVRAMTLTHPGKEDAEVIVDFGDRADGTPGVPSSGLLLDRDRRTQPVDSVDIGLAHLAEELAGIARQALDVPALAFGVQGVKRQRAFTRPRDPGEADQGAARQVERDVTKVVLAGTFDPYIRRGHPC